MFTKTNNLKIYYEIHGQGKPVVLLHGWGGNHNSWYPLTKLLQQQFQVITIDLPGFGESELPTRVWDTENYAEHVYEFINQITKSPNNQITIIGHSFVGTLATILASRYPQILEKLILIDAKIVKPPNSLRKSFYQMAARSGKIATAIFPPKTKAYFRQKLYASLGEHDYEQITGVIKQNFRNIIRKDYTKYLSHIKCPTLIVWGELDKDTPASDAKIIQDQIPHAQLEVIPESSHFAYLEKTDTVADIIIKFIGRKK